ncbi:MAG: hypothetical protein IT475_09620 [Aquimonas sp.]|nr:hypothetical protein [Aquimonas sp.]
MTSEVLILNKHAVVLAADSAVTTGPARDGQHPRYSKTATKLFELSDNGKVAVTIFGGAQIDLVPWELAIKTFRANSRSASFDTFDQYLEHLLAYLSKNRALFPEKVLGELTDRRFRNAFEYVVKLSSERDPSIFDIKVSLPLRQAAWEVVASTLGQEFAAKGVHPSLTAAAQAAMMSDIEQRVAGIQAALPNAPELAAIDPQRLAELAIAALYAVPTKFLASTGVVVAGYGEQDIFPGYKSVAVYGHVGPDLLVEVGSEFRVTHTDTSMIQALAQTSMIDVFTDGFGSSLWEIVRRASRKSLESFLTEIIAAGGAAPPAGAAPIIDAAHDQFMRTWTSENFKQNWSPLREVLATLSVQEMAHLAETLLTLESLKERVTSSSESVGGPIDVAAITKAEGLVWLKRKHFFDGDINMRYQIRLRDTLRS